MTGEFAELPEEYSCLPEEWTPPVKERIFSEDRVHPEQDAGETFPASEKNRSGKLGRKLKTYALSTVAAVTVVSAMAGPSPSPPLSEWDYERIDRDLSGYHFAYYAQSPAEIETYLENEMWYRYFGKLGDHEADYYGMYDRNDDGPSQAFRDALEVSEELQPDSSIPGLASYSYRILLMDAENDAEDLWSFGEVVLLESPYQVVVSYYENGVERFGFVEEAPSDTPIGEQQFRCNFDITVREDGTLDAGLRVFGNGVDIIGLFEEHLEEDGESYVVAHATDEHSNSACGNGLAYVIRIQRG